MLRFLGAFFVFVSISLVASASSCVVRSRNVVVNHGHVVHQAVFDPHVFQATEFVPIQVPTYVAEYGVDVDPALLRKMQQDVDSLRSEIGAIRSELVQFYRAQIQMLQYMQKPIGAPPKLELKQPEPAVEPKQPPKVDEKKVEAGSLKNEALAIITKHCARCHSNDNAVNEGRGIVLLDNGKLSAWSDRLSLKVSTAVYSGRMPKGGQMTDREVGVILSWLDEK